MTRRERAVEILKNELACVRNVDCERSECRNCNLVMPEHDITEALQMAIEVLEQESCEDAISRQTVLAILKDKWNMFSDANDAMQESIDTIEALPSGAPQPKIGHWIAQPSNKEQGERDFIWWKCSECGHVIFSESDRDRKEFHAYCGRCGAKMKDEEQ